MSTHGGQLQIVGITGPMLLGHNQHLTAFVTFLVVSQNSSQFRNIPATSLILS
jgi:hypothetical protein